MNRSILAQLSSQVGDRTEYSNRKVVMQCLEHPDLLTEIAQGLQGPGAALIGDCAEVFTKLAEERPEWVEPYAAALSPLISHKNTRVRWEAMHALALVARFNPACLSGLLPELSALLHHDKSVIVRDYATDALAAYAAAGRSEAQAAYPLLKEMLALWNGKQAGHALKGMEHVAIFLPDLHETLRHIASEFARSDRPVIRKVAKDLLKTIESQYQKAG